MEEEKEKAVLIRKIHVLLEQASREKLICVYTMLLRLAI